jgi:hypothetical protein
MTEQAGKQPNINELTGLLYQLAFDNDMKITLDDATRALVVFARRTPENGTRVQRGPNLRWKKAENLRALKLADMLQSALGKQALSGQLSSVGVTQSTNLAVPEVEATVSQRRMESEAREQGGREFDWDALAQALDVAFAAEDGSARGWLNDATSSIGTDFRATLRSAVGIEGNDGIGRLRASIEEDGVGLTRVQIGLLGIGLGYKIIEQKGELRRIDVQKPVSFEHYSHVLKVRGADADKFRSSYYGILQKLVLFAEHRSKKKTKRR